MFDIVIKGGRVIMGEGNSWFRGGVAKKDGRIVEVRPISGRTKRVIEASGKVVSLGFIDPQDHSDLKLLVNRRAEAPMRP